MRGRDIWIIFPVFCVLLGYLFWIHKDEPWTLMRIAGACLIIIGFSLWTLARVQLGDSFSVAAKASVLVTHGLYSRIRNPIYVFGSVMIAGGCLFFKLPVALLVFLLIIPLQVVRARKESQVLEEKFGDAYREYKKRTWF